jgi:hypothetical protein
MTLNHDLIHTDWYLVMQQTCQSDGNLINLSHIISMSDLSVVKMVALIYLKGITSRSQGSSVTTVSRLRAVRSGLDSWQWQVFFFATASRPALGPHPASYLMGTGGSEPRGVKLTTPFRPWYLIKHRIRLHGLGLS